MEKAKGIENHTNKLDIALSNSDYMQKTVIFFIPHPDDCEFGTPFGFLSLLEEGYRVIEVLMTDGSYGTFNSEFKGKRIKNIRKKELVDAVNVFQDTTQTTVELVRLEYIDGYLPFHAKMVNKVAKIIQKYNPSKIFAPDPWYSKDYHPDHVNTGRLVFFALKSLRSAIPTFYFYSSKQDRFQVVKRNMLPTIFKAIAQHRSQISPLNAKLVRAFYSIIIFINFIKFNRFVVGYRKQMFNKENIPIFPPEYGSEFCQRFKYHKYHFPALKGYEILHNMSPEELGLEIKEN